MCLSPWLALTLNFPISCWRGALTHVPGTARGQERAATQQFCLCFWGWCCWRGVSGGEDIPLAVTGCSGEPKVPCQGSGMWSKGCNVTTVHVAGCWGAAGWLLGTWRSPVQDPHPGVSEDAAHTDQRFPFLDPSRDSDLSPIPLPCTRREDAEPCPAGGAGEAVGRDPQPWAPGWTLGSAAASRGSWGGMRGMEHTPSSPDFASTKSPSVFSTRGYFFSTG